MQAPQTNKEGFVPKTLKSLNTFRTGFIAGFLLGALALAGAGHVIFNVFKFGQVTFGPNSSGQVGSPKTETSQTTFNGSANSQDNNPSVQGEGNSVAQNGSKLDHQESKNEFGGISAGGDVNLTIAYKDNSELPGFDSGKGYLSKPPNIGQFNDAIVVSNVSFGNRYFKSETQDVFIQGKKYKSPFHLIANQYEPTRVAFSLKNSPSPKGIFFQFGLGDWTSGTTTLTYLVKISADGELLWSRQIKYAERQIASVVLENKGYSDIVFEYQIVEAGNAQPFQNPLYFTDAKLLLK
jgi:hypothetical protein